MFEIYDSIELTLCITALIPCLILIVLYIKDFSTLRYPNFFKLELMIALLLNICLNFVRNYNYAKDNSFEIEGCNKNNKKFEIFGLIKSYLEVVILCLLASFNYLCYALLNTNNKNETKRLVSIILSIISLVLPAYNFLLYFLNQKHFISILGICLFIPDIKLKMNACLIPIIFLIAFIFFILTIHELHLKKKTDEENRKQYSRNIKRISFNFICQFIHFSIQYIKVAFILFDINKEHRYKYYNIINNISLTVVSISCFLEGKTREFYEKIIFDCLKLEKVESEINEEEEEYEDEGSDEDDEKEMKVYQESEHGNE